MDVLHVTMLPVLVDCVPESFALAYFSRFLPWCLILVCSASEVVTWKTFPRNVFNFVNCCHFEVVACRTFLRNYKCYQKMSGFQVPDVIK